MPGTGAELAEHLIDRFELEGVKVIAGAAGENYYSPTDKTVCLSPDVYGKKSLTAVAVATHEIGHAIQFCRDEPVSKLRGKYLGKADKIQKIGSMILISVPLITIAVKVPIMSVFIGVVGLVTMLSSVLMYVAVLPEEFDASFKKALPILKEGYLPDKYMSSANTVLKAAALTYVAAAMMDVLRLWRWLRFLR